MPTTFPTADIRKRIQEAGSDIDSLAFEMAYLASFRIPVHLSDNYIFVRTMKFKIPANINAVDLFRYVLTYGCSAIWAEKAERFTISYGSNVLFDGKILLHPEKGKRKNTLSSLMYFRGL